MKSLLSEIRYPIVLAPMLGVVTPAMVAGVSDAGGLGMLPLGGQSVEKSLQLIQETKRLTTRLFGVNLFANKFPDLTKNKELTEKMKNFISGIVREKGWSEHLEFDFHFHPYQDLIDIIIKESIKVVSFTFGLLDNKSVRKLKEHQIVLIGTATCREEALLLEKSGADMVIAQGIEAGGHRGTFVEGDLPQIGLFSLINQIVNSVRIPVIAAGGIHDSNTMAAAVNLGASAVQIGSHFIQATESLATDGQREMLQKSTDTSTILTKSFSGRWARGIRNEFINRTSHMDVPEYPIQNILTRQMRALAREHDDYEYVSIWAGQNANAGTKAPTSEIMNELIEHYKKIKP